MSGWRSVLLGLVVVACTEVPSEFGSMAFPRHGWSGSGPAALGSGTLAFDRGCLFLAQDRQTRFLVVWPGEARLVNVDGEPGVRIGDRTVGLGDPLQLGGGYYSDLAYVAGELRDGILPPDCLTPEIFMTTGFAED